MKTAELQIKLALKNVKISPLTISEIIFIETICIKQFYCRKLQQYQNQIKHGKTSWASNLAWIRMHTPIL